MDLFNEFPILRYLYIILLLGMSIFYFTEKDGKEKGSPERIVPNIIIALLIINIIMTIVLR